MNQIQSLDSSSSFNVRIQERQQWPSSSDSISRVDFDSIMNSQNLVILHLVRKELKKEKRQEKQIWQK